MRTELPLETKSSREAKLILETKALLDTKAWAFIFARGGSKGVPGKNIKNLAGMPLIAHSICTALKHPEIERVIVSTDNEHIARVAREYGAEVPFMRPESLSGDKSSEWLAWQHAINWFREHENLPDVFISLPATAPLRSELDITCSLSALVEGIDMVVTATKSTRSPWFNMLKVDRDNHCRLLIDGGGYTRRQDVPVSYDMTTVAYVCRPQYITSAAGVMDGNIKMVEIPAERAVDIDTELDFEWAEFLLKRGVSQ